MPFRLPAVDSAFTSLPGLCLCGHSCSFQRASPPSTCCVWIGRCCFGVRVPALLCEALMPQPCGHVVSPCFQGLQADVCTSFARACSVAVFCRRGHLVCKANLLSAVVLRLLPPSLHVLTRSLVVSGHHSTNPALCGSTGQRNWWSPSRSHKHQSSAHATDSSRDSSLFADTPCQLISIFPSRLTAVPPSSLTQAILCRIHCFLCLSSLSSRWAAGLDAVLAVSESGGACCPSWALTLPFQAPLHTRPQISLCIVRSVNDSYFLVPHRLL